MNKQRAGLLGATVLIMLPPIAAGQGRMASGRAEAVSSASSNRVEPLRVLGGTMLGHVVHGETRVAGRTTPFNLVLGRADLEGGQLRFKSTFELVAGRSKSRSEVTATITGSTAKPINFWARAQMAPVKDPSTLMTSLYQLPEPGTGCEVLFFRLALPAPIRARIGAGPAPLQLGVALASSDNQSGHELNRQICRIIGTSKDSRDPALASRLDELNRLLTTQ